MKKNIWIAAVVILFAAGGMAAYWYWNNTRPVRAVFIIDKVENRHIGIDFYRGNKKLSSFRIKEPRSLQFMTPEIPYEGELNRFVHAEHNYHEVKDISPFLVDMKGNGDKRYLLTGLYHGGNYHSWDGVLIDVKNNFAVLGPMKVGEICHFPKHNPELIFDYDQAIYSLWQQEAFISLSFKLRPDAAPEILTVPKDFQLPINKFKNALLYSVLL